VVENEAVQFYGYKYSHEIVLSPGLKITLGERTTILVGVPDAVEFAQELRQAQAVVEEDARVMNSDGTITTQLINT
jgi:DNA-directed RNA polymerase subunit L